MQKFILSLFIIILASYHTSAAGLEEDSRAKAIMDTMFSASEEIETLQYMFHKNERMRNGTIRSATQLVKLQRTPYRVYLALNDGGGGREVIYDTVKSNSKLIAHRGSFPDITVRLDIRGNMATENEHHTVNCSGFDYALGLIKNAIAEARENDHGERMTYEGLKKVDGDDFHHVVLHAGSKESIKVRAGNRETVFAFAERIKSNPYLLVYYNPDIDGVTATLKDKDYVVPAYYAKRTEIWINPQTNMLRRQRIYDFDDNLYEEYEYRDLIINPALSDMDFDPNNPNYGF